MSFFNPYIFNEASIKGLIEKSSSEMTKSEYETDTKKIFRYIDLINIQISKDQEEIRSLAEETDELLNLLEYEAS